MEVCCEHCKKVEQDWIVLHSMNGDYFCNSCGKKTSKLKPLVVGQKVAFNWKDGVMITEVSKIIEDTYFCFMHMTNKKEDYKRYELSDDTSIKALRTAFRIIGD